MRGSSASCSQPQVDDDAFWGGIRQEFPDIVFINPDEVICIKGLCSPVLEGVLLYRDEGHLNDVGSRLIGRKLLARGVSFFR